LPLLLDVTSSVGGTESTQKKTVFAAKKDTEKVRERNGNRTSAANYTYEPVSIEKLLSNTSFSVPSTALGPYEPDKHVTDYT
jgi:hypothetical protein